MGVADSILLVSPLDDSIYAVVEMQAGASSVTQVGGVTEFVTLAFTTQGGNTMDFLSLSRGGQYPPELTTVSYVALLEELQFYIREERAIPGDPTSELTPRLSRAQVFPGTAIAYDDDTDNLTGDLSDNILDLQVAIGVDTVPTDGLVVEGDGTSTTPTDDDEWLFNHAGDDPTDVKWANTLASPARLFYLRISTLAKNRSARHSISSPSSDPDRRQRLFGRAIQYVQHSR